jgi:hypothetical protein
MQNKTHTNGSIAIYADAMGYRPALDVHAGLRNRTIETAGRNGRTSITANLGADAFSTLDFGSWLPFAAPEYCISKSVQDYVLVPVIAMPTDLPNRNGVAFPLRELKQWRIDQGMIAYQTFKGKPVHIEHDNQNPVKAIGVIVDTALVPMTGFGGGKLWKLLLLLAIDRSKDPTYTKYIMTGEINSYSMGAWVEKYSCGYCNAPAGACNHINLNRPRDFYTLDDQLVFRNVHGVVGFETSVVRDPAYFSALSDRLMTYS